MKAIKLITMLVFLGISGMTYAQTVQEILDKYVENTGGRAKWEAMKGMKMTASVNQQGMEIPLTIISLKDGRQTTNINFQGMSIKQNVFDGTTLWSTNFMSMKAEKSDAETTAIFKATATDFPDPFLNYKAKGYQVELLGKESIEGTETFKIKLTKKPVMVDGQLQDDISYYFFDTENFVPIMVEAEIKSGQGKGMISQTTMSDYQEVDGLFFPFSMAQGVKGLGAQPIVISKIELNPTVDDSEFIFPEDK